MKTKQELQLEAVKAILNGELLLEEAMEKYAIKDRRTISAWVRKFAPQLLPKVTLSETDKTSNTNILHTDQSQTTVPQTNLPKQLRNFEARIQQLEELNNLLIRQMNLLAERFHQLNQTQTDPNELA